MSRNEWNLFLKKKNDIRIVTLSRIYSRTWSIS